MATSNSIAPATTPPNPSHKASQPKPKPESIPSKRPHPSSLYSLSQTLFNPNFKPLRSHPAPKPPSIASSRLPPSAAEIDERPRWRVRRFRMWRDAAPGLRVAVLDPRKRGHLRRYRPFNTPTPPTYFRGRFRTHINNHPLPNSTPMQRIPQQPRISTKFKRKAQFKRLMACKYTLDIEHERRFRRGMSGLVKEVVEFERDWCVGEGVDELGVNGRGNVEWKVGVDIERIKTVTRFFKDIRKSSDNVFDYLDPAEFARVPMREEIKKRVKEGEKIKKRRKEEKRARKLRESEQMANQLVGVSQPIELDTMAGAMATTIDTPSISNTTVPIPVGKSHPAMVKSQSDELAPLTPVVPLVETSASSVASTSPLTPGLTSISADDLPLTIQHSSRAAKPKSKKKKTKAKKVDTLLLEDTSSAHQAIHPSTPSPTDSDILLTPTERCDIDTQIQHALARLQQLSIEPTPETDSIKLKSQPRHRSESMRTQLEDDIKGEVVYHMIRIRDLATSPGRTRTLLVQAPKDKPLNLQTILPKIMAGTDGQRLGIKVNAIKQPFERAERSRDPIMEVSKDRMANLVDMVEVPLPSTSNGSALIVDEEAVERQEDKEVDSASTADTSFTAATPSTSHPLHWAYQDDDTKLNPLSTSAETSIDLTTVTGSDISDVDSIEDNEGLYAFPDDYDDPHHLDDDRADTLREGIEDRRSARDTLLKSSIHSKVSERLRWVS